jgi:hypothetical protein
MKINAKVSTRREHTKRKTGKTETESRADRDRESQRVTYARQAAAVFTMFALGW